MWVSFFSRCFLDCLLEFVAHTLHWNSQSYRLRQVLDFATKSTHFLFCYLREKSDFTIWNFETEKSNQTVFVIFAPNVDVLFYASRLEKSDIMTAVKVVGLYLLWCLTTKPLSLNFALKWQWQTYRLDTRLIVQKEKQWSKLYLKEEKKHSPNRHGLCFFRLISFLHCLQILIHHNKIVLTHFVWCLWLWELFSLIRMR